MKCYQCGAVLSEDNVCLKCGADVTVYRTVVRASNAYYNLGLAKAQSRDLSGAVESLKTSLMINKNNVKARNLLGLVYCEMGDVVEALSEWVISKNQKPEKNIANIYITKIQSNQGRFETVIQTIKKYNQSLSHAKDGNFDMAVIQLKKITVQNPKLIKAQQLLALLYIRENEFTRARKCLNAILKVDKNNILAQRYLRELDTNENSDPKDVSDSFLPKRKTKEINYRPLSGNDVLMPPTKYKEPSNGAITIIYILIGVVIGAALTGFLLMPARFKGQTAAYNQSIIEYSEKLSSSNIEINSLTTELEKVKTERDTLAKQVESISGTGGSNKLLISVIDAANAYIAGDKVKAAESLVGIDVSSLPTDTAKSLSNTISAGSTIAAAAELYTSGTTNYYKNAFTEAADFFARSYRLDSSKVDAAYYAAKSYEAINQADNAKKYYQFIVTNFPASQYIAEAAKYISSH